MSSEKDFIVRVGHYGFCREFYFGLDPEGFLGFEEDEAKRVVEWAKEKYPTDTVWYARRDSEDARKRLPLSPHAKEFLVRVGTKFYGDSDEPTVEQMEDSQVFKKAKAEKIARRLIGEGYSGVYVAHESRPFRSVSEL